MLILLIQLLIFAFSDIICKKRSVSFLQPHLHKGVVPVCTTVCAAPTEGGVSDRDRSVVVLE